jgi:hypothetical protein
MKKNLLLAAALLIAGGVFAQEYTIYFGGDIKGIISVQKDRGGKITITPNINYKESFGTTVWIGKAICPILPEDGFSATKYTKSIVIDGNTTTETTNYGSGDSWDKTVIDGNTTTKTFSSGGRITTTIDGNTLTSGAEKQVIYKVINGNTLIYTGDDGSWDRIVVTENTLTQTDASGSWAKVVINGNTTTITGKGVVPEHNLRWGNEVHIPEGEEVIRGNTRTRTYTDGKDGGYKIEKYLTSPYSNGGGYKEVIDGNTITITSLDGKSKTVVDKQGNDIFITITGYCSYLYDIGVSEKDRYKSIIDAIISGRIKDGFFDHLITRYL